MLYCLFLYCMAELEESCSKKRKISQENKAAHNSSRTSVLTKLLITLRELAHEAAHNSSQTSVLTKLLIIVHELAYKSVHSTQKIIYIRFCLYIIQVHEQLANHCKLLANICKLGGNFNLQSTVFHYTIPSLNLAKSVHTCVPTAQQTSQ